VAHQSVRSKMLEADFPPIEELTPFQRTWIGEKYEELKRQWFAYRGTVADPDFSG
jgi:hypothetical protein